MLTAQHITYLHPVKDVLFENISLSIARHQKIALIGNNGAGKSTLLKILAGILQPSEGILRAASVPYYIPQLYGQYNHLRIAQALGVEQKLAALRQILSGEVTEENMTLLADDWTIEERCQEALAWWQLDGIDLGQPMASLSGGQKTKVFLAGISIHQPETVLLDEPTNHLDSAGRQLLYKFIAAGNATVVVVSHDRTLLNQLDAMYELSKKGITVYGGNYDFYTVHKGIEGEALTQDVKSKEKALRKAKETERETAERQQKLDARGKKKQEKAGIPTIAMNTLRNNAEKSTSKLKGVHTGKIDGIARELDELRAALPDLDKMKFGFDDAALHKGKILVTASGIDYAFGGKLLWQQPLSFQMVSGERVAIKGANGSGKTTLIKLMLGQLQPTTGQLYRADCQWVYIDQDYSLIDDSLKVYEQAQRFNQTALQEHEVKIRLSRFLFTKADWDKPCSVLSGGEKMRLMLCCLTIGSQAPDLILLDEPTNNLDLQNIGILTNAINDYQGTLLVISHDDIFLEEVNVQRMIVLE